MNVQPEKPPSQIDYILVSSRWATSVRSCTNKWGPVIEANGRKYDHALVRMNFKLRLKCIRATSVRKDLLSLKKPETAKLHNDIIEEKLTNSERPQTVNDE